MKYFELILLLYLVLISYCDERNPRIPPRRGPRGRPDPISLPERSRRLPAKEQFTITDIDVRQYINTSGHAMKEQDFEDLTSRSFSTLFDGTGPVDENGPGYDATHDAWEAFVSKIDIPWTGDRAKFEHHTYKLFSCFFIGITYSNANTEIRDYYKMRYLYVNNLDYEMGYLIEEIIVHYQIVVELYHLMVRKYGIQRDRYFVPVTYMFYIYTNILKQSTVIINLCNMLHELEAKYTTPPDTVFQDYHLSQFSKQKSKLPPHDKDGLKKYEKMIEDRKKRQQREERKKRKEQIKHGLYSSTTRTKRPRKGPFDFHYGWSIEYW